jgi:tRNA (guanine37-N1)-methyltransferase
VRLDVVTIFPAYLDPLSLSLAGKARDKGLLEVHVHDLREWTHDRHRSVDDTPYGGGAGMVMKPEPWGEALDAIVPDGAATTLVVPTPSGRPFTQALARELSTQSHLVFACGRYEGIDQRVVDHARTRMRVEEVSIGDYVLNGGEVAALAIIEAMVRLVPGFMGNAASLVEESHEDGLLEAPVYTKPPAWRDLEVPPVLLSGDHDAIAGWRHDQALRRTAERRPDLLAPASVPGSGELRPVRPADAGELLTLQLACWVKEEQDNPGVPIPALRESVDDVRAWMADWTVLVLRRQGRLVGAARARRRGRTWDIGRLMVAPDLWGQGLGRFLLEQIEAAAPPGVTSYELFTGAGSARNQRLYKRAGYRLRGEPEPGVVVMTKRRRG